MFLTVVAGAAIDTSVSFFCSLIEEELILYTYF